MAVKIKEKVTADGKKFQKMLEDLNKLEVRIGIQQGAGSEDGVDLVDIAMFNELGTVHIPSRPFLRDSVDAHSPEINAFLQSMRTQLVKGGSAEDVLKKIGVFQKGLIQKEIVNGNFVQWFLRQKIFERGFQCPLCCLRHAKLLSPTSGCSP